MKDRSQILAVERGGPGLKRQGELDAFDSIWQKYSAHVYNFISSMIFDKSLAEDLMQEVFLKIWEKRDEIDSERNVEAYVFTIARNLVYKETRKMLVNANFVDYLRSGVEEADESTENAIDSSSEHDRLTEVIHQMPPARRDIYLLNKVHGLSIKDIAERLNVSSKTVENQLYQAKRFIKSKFSMSVFVLLWIYITYGKL
jgi:RNA polymerase sigma-70 factor (ECF subfamily)